MRKKPYTGHQIESIRDKLDLTQEDFGKLLGTTGRTVSRWENKREKPVPIRSEIHLRILAELEEKAATSTPPSDDVPGHAGS